MALPFLCTICNKCEYGLIFPVHKVMKAVGRMLMLNEIEAVFLAYLIKETRWNIKEKIITRNAEHVRDIICVALDHFEYRCLILYLMLCSYTVKYYLNDEADDGLEEANRVCPNFLLVFESWAKKHNNLTSRISPRLLNRVYKDIYNCSRHDIADFNRMVDSIIQISPAYNPEREKIKMEEAKAKNQKLHDRNDRGMENSGIVNPESISIPMFSSSGFFHLFNAQIGNASMGGPCGFENPQNSFINYMVSSREKPRRHSLMGMLNSSVGGISQNFALKDEEDECQELLVGLEDGHSEEDLYFAR